MTHRTDSGVRPHFVIVGSPRSGTTLVQRLTSELPGVAVTPETHFFSLFYPQVLARLAMPLNESALRSAVQQYLRFPVANGLDLEEEAIVQRLGGTCVSAFEMFGAIVDELSGGATLVGEKTPDHLRWWRPLTKSQPSLKLIAVFRDPRAVVASMLDVPFGMSSALLLAAQWREDQRDLTDATRTLDERRLLRLRFEEVVDDPIGTREEIANFLGVETGGVGKPSEGLAELYAPWETSWKSRAVAPVDAGRAHAWQERLSKDDVASIELVARPVLRQLGYVTTRSGSALTHARVTPSGALKYAHFRTHRVLQRSRISKAMIGHE